MVARSLTRRIFPYRFTVPSGTAIVVPHVEALDVPDTILRRLELTIPSGHVGLTGVAFFMQGQQMIPQPGTLDWIVADGTDLAYDIPGDLEVDGAIVAHGYNLGIYDHSFYVRFVLDDIRLGATAAPVGNALVL